MTADTPRWTEIEHLPECDEEFYNIYTCLLYTSDAADELLML